MAEEAWKMLSRAGAIDESLSDWRRREAIGACKRRISEALNADYETLEAHFLAMAGKPGKAFNAAMRAESNPARQARHKLDKLLLKHRLQPDYAAKIMRDKFKTTLDAASEKQLWAIYFDVQRNMKNRPGPTGEAWLDEVTQSNHDCIPY